MIEQDRAARKKELDEVRRAAPTLGETPEQKAERETAAAIKTVMDKVQEEFGDDAVDILTAAPQDTEFRCTNLMRDTILEKENAPKILGYAAENPKVFAKIASMSIRDQVREIDKLAATLETKKETRAPAPVSQVEGKGGGKADTSKMTDAEYHAWRQKQKLNSA
jgi:flagellar biosynthesis GTPase FlhF